MADENQLVPRPPDSETMTYTELRQLIGHRWPVWLIDELAHGLAEQDQESDF